MPFQIHISIFNPQFLLGKIHVTSRVQDVGNLSSIANFARFSFPSLFPQLHRAIYLDADTIVRGDIVEFWEELQTSSQLLVAVPRYTWTPKALLSL